MPTYVVPLVSKIASRLDDYLPSPFAGEIRGTVRERVTTNINDKSRQCSQWHKELYCYFCSYRA